MQHCTKTRFNLCVSLNVVLSLTICLQNLLHRLDWCPGGPVSSQHRCQSQPILLSCSGELLSSSKTSHTFKTWLTMACCFQMQSMSHWFEFGSNSVPTVSFMTARSPTYNPMFPSALLTFMVPVCFSFFSSSTAVQSSFQG